MGGGDRLGCIKCGGVAVRTLRVIVSSTCYLRLKFQDWK